MLPAVEVTVVSPAMVKPGFISQIVDAGDAIYAVGGTYHAPTLLCSTDRGRTFVPWRTPKTSGLRGLFVHAGAVWIIGEYGLVAYTRNGGARWTKATIAETEGTTCLYCIDRDTSGRFWMTGDNGLVLRSTTKAPKQFEVIPTRTTGRVIGLWIDTADGTPWLLDTTSTIQRFDGKRWRIVKATVPRPKMPLCQIKRTPAGSLIVIGDSGVILRSTTNGKTWKRVASHTKVDFSQLVATRFGIIAVGFEHTMLVSYDDGKTMTPIPSAMTGRLWAIADAGDAILVGGDDGVIYRIANRELAKPMHEAYAKRDATLAALAGNVRDGLDGAELVLEDALRERGLY